MADKPGIDTRIRNAVGDAIEAERKKPFAMLVWLGANWKSLLAIATAGGGTFVGQEVRTHDTRQQAESSIGTVANLQDRVDRWYDEYQECKDERQELRAALEESIGP